MPTFEVTEILKARAKQQGESGQAWLDNIDTSLTALADAWQLELKDQLFGGTEAIVFSARQHDGNDAVLKLSIWDSLGQEAKALTIAAGHGYAELYQYSEDHNALLLEPLGAKLLDAPLSIEEKIRIITSCLKHSWRPVADAEGLMLGSEKADWHIDHIQNMSTKHGQTGGWVNKALDFAHQRKAAHSSDTSVLVHGDAHMWNTLQAKQGYKLVDPDGLYGEPALDLCISLREWTDDLITNQSGPSRAEFIAELAGVDLQAIWQWAFIEHVSTGLLFMDLEYPEEARTHLTIAEQWQKIAL